MSIKKDKVAFITGITGQDGAYLSEFLLKKGYEVHGMKRRSSLFNTDRIDHLYQDPHIDNRNFFLHYGDMTDSTNITRLIKQIKPDEIYNLAAMSHVAVSFEIPEYTANADGLGTLRILDAVRLLGFREIHKKFIKLLPQSCMVRLPKHLRQRPHHFIQTLPMLSLKCTHTG